MSDLCGHRLELGHWGGLGGLGGWAGLGDAGNEALGQLGGTLQGAAGIGADVLEGGKGDHEGEDAPARIAGSYGDGGSGEVLVDVCSVHIFVFLFRASLPFH